MDYVIYPWVHFVVSKNNVYYIPQVMQDGHLVTAMNKGFGIKPVLSLKRLESFTQKETSAPSLESQFAKRFFGQAPLNS